MNRLMKVKKQADVMKKNKKRGFTLVELIVVIAIIAILAALLIPLVSKYINQATEARGQANARAVYTAAAAYGAAKISDGATPVNPAGSAQLKPYLGENVPGTYSASMGADGSVIWAEWQASGGGTNYVYPKGAK